MGNFFSDLLGNLFGMADDPDLWDQDTVNDLIEDVKEAINNMSDDESDGGSDDD